MELVVWVARDGDDPRLLRMFELPMTALLTGDIPAIIAELP
jgi:hypothetical protein